MRKLLIPIALLGLALPGCYHARFVTNAAPGQVHSETSHFFLGGLIGHAVYDTSRVCPNGVSSIHARTTFLDGFLTGLTGGIWAPRTVTVVCAAGGAAKADQPLTIEVALDDADRIIAAAMRDADGKLVLAGLGADAKEVK